MKFIHCFSEDLKGELLKSGFRLVSDLNGLFIFENNSKLRFDFNSVDRKSFIFTDKMIF